MNVISTIIKREFLNKVKNKSFIVMTFLSPLIFVLIAVVVGVVMSIKGDTKLIAIHDANSIFKNAFESDTETKFEYFDQTDVSVLKDSLKNNYFEGIVYIPKVNDLNLLKNQVEYISNNNPNMELVVSIEEAIAKKVTTENYITAGIDTMQLRLAKSKISLKLSKSSGEEGLKGVNEIKIGFGFFFGYLIMLFILIYGNMVMRSVIEEKTNRIIEIIISSVKPFQLMMGKIIGTSFAGLLQFGVWVILLSVVYLVAGSVFASSTPQNELLNNPEMVEQASKFSFKTIQNYIAELNVASTVIFFLIYFVGGYFLYCSLYAAIGAAVDNETDSQQFLMPIMLPLILGMYIGFATVINDPHGPIAVVFSIFPLTSPIVMLMRVPFGVPWWQLLISIGLLYGFFVFVVWLAGKIYRVGILMYGKKPTWKELYQWLKY